MRQYKITVKNDVDFSFFVHDDNNVEIVQNVEPMPLMEFQKMMTHMREMVHIMRDLDLTIFKVEKL